MSTGRIVAAENDNAGMPDAAEMGAKPMPPNKWSWLLGTVLCLVLGTGPAA